MRKIALITGGTGGLGIKIVEDLISDGYFVISVSRDKDKIKKAENKLSENDCMFVPGDIIKSETINFLYSVINKKFGKLDALINNAGIIYSGGIETLENEEWLKTMDTNLNAPFLITKKMLPLLIAGKGSIVNISSISSKVIGSSISYSASKAAIDIMTQSLAKDLAKYKIRVNSINPGMLNTGFQISNNIINESEYNLFLENMSNDYPLGIGSAEDISNLVIFLLSYKAKWITGVNYIIDGGYSLNK